MDSIGIYSMSIEEWGAADSIKQCKKRLPLKKHSSRERNNFPKIDFETSDLQFEVSNQHLKAHNFVWKGCFFLSLLSRNFDDQLSSNFHRFVIIFMNTLRYTKWEDWSLILPIVSRPMFLEIITNTDDVSSKFKYRLYNSLLHYWLFDNVRSVNHHLFSFSVFIIIWKVPGQWSDKLFYLMVRKMSIPRVLQEICAMFLPDGLWIIKSLFVNNKDILVSLGPIYLRMNRCI